MDVTIVQKRTHLDLYYGVDLNLKLFWYCLEMEYNDLSDVVVSQYDVTAPLDLQGTNYSPSATDVVHLKSNT